MVIKVGQPTHEEEMSKTNRWSPLLATASVLHCPFPPPCPPPPDCVDELHLTAQVHAG